MIKVIIKEKKHKEHFIGGAADNIPYSKFNQRDLEKGKEKEMRDHGMPPSVAKEIAADEIAKDSPNLNEEEQKTLVRDLMANVNKYKNSTWIFFDTETTGLEPVKAQLTEIAGLAINPDFHDTETNLGQYETKISLTDEIQKRRNEPFVPTKKGELSIDQILKMTQYDVSKSSEYPDEKTAISNFYNFLKNMSSKGKIVLVAHNAKFDKSFIDTRAKLYSLPPIEYDVIDTLQIMQEIYQPVLMVSDKLGVLPKIKTKFGTFSFTLGNITKALEIENKNWHSATADVKMLILATKAVLKYIDEHIDLDVTAAHKQVMDKKKKFSNVPATPIQTTEAAKKKKPVTLDPEPKTAQSDVPKTKNFWVLMAPPAAGKSTWFKNVLGVDVSGLHKKYGIINGVGYISEDAIFDSDSFQEALNAISPDKGRVTSTDIYSGKIPASEDPAIMARKEKIKQAMIMLHAESKKAIEQVLAAGPDNIVVDRLHSSTKTRKQTLNIVSSRPEYRKIAVEWHTGEGSGSIDDIVKMLSQRDIQRATASAGVRKPMDPSRIKDVLTKLRSEPPSKAEGFDEIISGTDTQVAKDFLQKDQQTLKEYNYDDYLEWLNNSQLQKDLESKTFLTEKKLSPYWKVRVERRAAKAGRPARNPIDRKWGEEQQMKSERIDQAMLRLFEKELGMSNELAEEASKMMRQVRHQRKKMQEKKKEGYPQDKRFGPGKKASGSVPTKPKTGILKKIKSDSKKIGGPTYSGEGYGPMGESKDENK